MINPQFTFRGSALLITVLMMGLLMTLTLGISNLVLREIRVTGSIVAANQAYYAAEAGVEVALSELSKNGPGYENEGEGQGVKYDFKINNQSNKLPDFPTDQVVFVQPSQIENSTGGLDFDCVLSSPKNELAVPKQHDDLYRDCPRATYRKLVLNETAIVPLFTVDETGETKDVEDFMVEYYMNIANGDNFYGPFQGMKLESFDVLRWKIYGKPKLQGGEATKTESIADIYPAITNNSPVNPVCIGTDSNLRAVADSEFQENCIFPKLDAAPPGDVDANAEENGSNLILWSAARECYMSDAGAYVTNNQAIKGTKLANDPDYAKANFLGVCSMKDFLVSHKQNYLLLTNLVNPNIVGITNVSNPDQLSRADIYYRVLVPSESKLPKDFAQIVANGFSFGGNVVKTLQVNYKKPGFLPVFNFSLYATSSGSAEGGGEENNPNP